MSDNKQKNQYAAKAFLGDFGKFLLGSLPGVSETAAYFTPAAAEARKDQSGFFPELGISEGMRSLMPSKRFLPAVIKGGVRVTPGLSETAALLTPAAFEARKDQSGFLPNIGFKEGSRALDPLGGYRNDFTQNQLNADAIALAEDTGRTVDDAKQILGGGLETVIGGSEEGVDAVSNKGTGKDGYTVGQKVTAFLNNQSPEKRYGENNYGGNRIPLPPIVRAEDFDQRRNKFDLTPEEQKTIIMSPLEQEMYW